MVVAAVACVVGLVVVGWALYRDDPLPPPAPRRLPDWGPLPEPADLVRTDFGKAVPGYDPASVDAHVDALTVAYRDLLAEAPPEAVARARRRAAARRGLTPPPEHPVGDAPTGTAAWADAEGQTGGAPSTATDLAPGVTVADDPREALRAEAALAVLRDAIRQR